MCLSFTYLDNDNFDNLLRFKDTLSQYHTLVALTPPSLIFLCWFLIKSHHSHYDAKQEFIGKERLAPLVDQISFVLTWILIASHVGSVTTRLRV